ncbi:MAG: BlaI/MecI/CopY family transcriptional regulator [Bacteroidales bacterium]|nr:BlaI/MecI/CopY family transcriptional regulator [Bacteroidales bacterium]
MKELTKAEEQIMQILWEIEAGFVKDILEVIPEPKPAYNTVSTIVRILERKGFVSYRSFGKTHQYFPTVSKGQYRKSTLKNIVKGYFDNSFSSLVSHFTQEQNVSVEELDAMLQTIQNQIKLKQKEDE